MAKNIKPKNVVVSILSKLSHELKTPIHGVKGISSYLLDNWDNLSNSEKRNIYLFSLKIADYFSEKYVMLHSC